MRSVGADRVIDYRRDDFTRTSQLYDLILDLAAHRSCSPTGVRWHPAARIGAWVGRCPRCYACLPSADWLGGLPVALSGFLLSRRGRPTLSRLPPSALPGTSGSTSTARSRSTRFPPRLLMSVRDAHPAKWLSPLLMHSEPSAERKKFQKHERADRGGWCCRGDVVAGNRGTGRRRQQQRHRVLRNRGRVPACGRWPSATGCVTNAARR